MNDICNRAKEFANVCKKFNCDACDWSDCNNRDLYKLYIEIATEQRTADIKNAFIWIITTYLGDYIDKEGYIDNVKLANDLQKALEE